MPSWGFESMAFRPPPRGLLVSDALELADDGISSIPDRCSRSCVALVVSSSCPSATSFSPVLT